MSEKVRKKKSAVTTIGFLFYSINNTLTKAFDARAVFSPYEMSQSAAAEMVCPGPFSNHLCIPFVALISGTSLASWPYFSVHAPVFEWEKNEPLSFFDQYQPPWLRLYDGFGSDATFNDPGDPPGFKIYGGLPTTVTQKSGRGTEVFSQGWPGQATDTVCGWGSSESHTRLVRKELYRIIERYHVMTLDDAGCGDLAWISMVNLDGIDYLGYDAHERSTWPELRRQGYRLETADITASDLRPADLLICRDVFIHLPNDMILPALERFRRSAKLLLATSYTSNSDVEGGEFSNFERMKEPSLTHAKLDMTLPPFGLGKPLEYISEESPNKYLGLWDMRHLLPNYTQSTSC